MDKFTGKIKYINVNELSASECNCLVAFIKTLKKFGVPSLLYKFANYCDYGICFFYDNKKWISYMCENGEICNKNEYKDIKEMIIYAFNEYFPYYENNEYKLINSFNTELKNFEKDKGLEL